MEPCIYCRGTDGPFTSREHPLPESLGNTETTLPVGMVCDPCNNGPLARIDQVFVNFMPVASLRVLQGIPNKAGAYPHFSFANMALSMTGPTDIKIVMREEKGFKRQPDGFKVEMVGRKFTAKYAADVARFFHKAALGFMSIDYNRDFVLEQRFDPIREIVRGAEYHGYMLMSKQHGPPGPSVRFTYQLVQIDGEESVLTWMDVFGLQMATDLLVRKTQDFATPVRRAVESHPVLALVSDLLGVAHASPRTVEAVGSGRYLLKQVGRLRGSEPTTQRRSDSDARRRA